MDDSERDPSEAAGRVGPVVDANIHLWDQATNPVFWLSDRTLLTDMLGDYTSLPDRYAIDDYLAATAPFDVEGVVWSDPGANDPLAAIEWVEQQAPSGLTTAIVTLADPSEPGFADFITKVADHALVTGVRIRLVADLQEPVAGAGSDGAGTSLVDHLAPLVDSGLTVVIETSDDQLAQVAELARALPQLPIVLDHFGWPSDLSDAGRDRHLARLEPIASAANVTTRIDAIGTIFGAWTTDEIAPWLRAVVDLFGTDRCMLGSDLPIETLRSSFGRLYSAFDTIFRDRSDDDRAHLFAGTARRVLARRRSS